MTQDPRLVLGLRRRAVGYKVSEEGRALNAKAVNWDFILKATDSHHEPESEIRKVIVSS